MIGAGPQLVRTSTPTARATYFGGEVALDLMVWPTRRFGLWVEPSYEFTFHPSGVSHGIGITGGLLIGWWRQRAGPSRHREEDAG